MRVVTDPVVSDRRKSTAGVHSNPHLYRYSGTATAITTITTTTTITITTTATREEERIKLKKRKKKWETIRVEGGIRRGEEYKII